MGVKFDDAVVTDARPRLGVLGYLLLGLSAFFLAVSGVVLGLK